MGHLDDTDTVRVNRALAPTPAHTHELFESNSRFEVEARLHHLIKLKGIGLITSGVGSGKTTVCRLVAQALYPGLYRVDYVSLTTRNVLDMYKSIAWQLGLWSNRETFLATWARPNKRANCSDEGDRTNHDRNTHQF